ncbi:MAG: hypothetical protein ACEQSB_06270 [Undibacterium sp.]
MTKAEAQRFIAEECDALKKMLLEKNESYGSSFSEPLKLGGKDISAEDQIWVRLGDKFKRIIHGSEYPGDDTILDVIGYFILLRVVQKYPSKTTSSKK